MYVCWNWFMMCLSSSSVGKVLNYLLSICKIYNRTSSWCLSNHHLLAKSWPSVCKMYTRYNRIICTSAETGSWCVSHRHLLAKSWIVSSLSAKSPMKLLHSVSLIATSWQGLDPLSATSPQDIPGWYVYVVKLVHDVSLIVICWQSLELYLPLLQNLHKMQQDDTYIW